MDTSKDLILSQAAGWVLVIRKVNSIYIPSEKGIFDAGAVDGDYDTVGLTWGKGWGGWLAPL